MRTDDHCADLINQALSGLQKGNLQQVWLLLQTARDWGCHHVELHIGFGAVYERMGELVHAYAAFDYAVGLGRNSPQAYNNRGRMAMLMGWTAEAMADYQQALALQPENGRAYYNIGGFLEQQGRIDEALASFQRAVDHHYAPALEAIKELQAQVAKMGPRRPPAGPPLMSAEEAFFARALLRLASFAYATLGADRRLSVVESKGLLSMGRKEQISQQMRWMITIEEMHEVDITGYRASRRGATLEIVAREPFLLRVTSGPADDCELSLWHAYPVAGTKQQAFKKVNEHSYTIKERSLALMLKKMLANGVLQI